MANFRRPVFLVFSYVVFLRLQRMHSFDLLLETLTQPIRQQKIGRFRIHHNLQSMVARQAPRQVLIQPACHRQHVHGSARRNLTEHSKRNGERKQ